MERRGSQSHPIPDGIDGQDSQAMTAPRAGIRNAEKRDRHRCLRSSGTGIRNAEKRHRLTRPQARARRPVRLGFGMGQFRSVT